MARRKLSTFERLQRGERLQRRERRELQRKLEAGDAELKIVHPDAAGIDVGSASHFVSVPAGRDPEPVREFGSWTADLHKLAGAKNPTPSRPGARWKWSAFYAIAEVSEFPDHARGARAFGLGADRRTPFLVADPLVKD